MVRRTRTRRLSTMVVAVLLASAFVFLGRAQAEPTAKERKSIATLIRNAQKAKSAADRFAKRRKTKGKAKARYKLAARRFLEAYRLSEEPALLVRLAAVYEARGENEWAQRLYERYLELAPSGSESSRALRRASALAERDTAADSVGDAELDPSEFYGEDDVAVVVAVDEPEEAEAEAPVAVEIEAAPSPAPTAKDPGRVLRYAGLGAGIAGLVAVGLGVKFGMDAGSLSDELSAKEGAWTLDDRETISDGEQAETLAIVLSAVGAASLIGGGVLYYMGATKTSESQGAQHARLVPQYTGESMTISWMGSF